MSIWRAQVFLFCLVVFSLEVLSLAHKIDISKKDVNAGELHAYTESKLIEIGSDDSVPKMNQIEIPDDVIEGDKLSSSLCTRGKGGSSKNSGRSSSSSDSSPVFSQVQNLAQVISFGSLKGDVTSLSKSASWSGTYLNFRSGGVRVVVVSPRYTQLIVIEGSRGTKYKERKKREVYVNGKNICDDARTITYKIPTHQIRRDGSMWYTNLSLGRPMTEQEMQVFRRELAKAERRKRAVEAVLKEVAKMASRTGRDGDINGKGIQSIMKLVEKAFQGWDYL